MESGDVLNCDLLADVNMASLEDCAVESEGAPADVGAARLLTSEEIDPQSQVLSFKCWQ